MQKIVSITSQGQVSIPQAFLRSLGINQATKAVLQINGNTLEIHPKGDFWSLESSLKSDIKLDDQALRKARQKFSTSWANK
ncbi:hypothetical protein A3F34_01530 [Candidatus Roizmanbacteria bacterium RIFCSPHIGHO2_12_FULL_44_10]|uniref:SpoVT-AbrB domain-containing protein n=1 Tax=Candidatus Roizmanbacteria bacterium RIFCSPHIGHO2_12_FULL_44_10 TaxID=1802054 RepID=A0A1F7I687_9BACT|nr:MAG: hypothetical protein A3F34_01530 [Candidatus Roizmanbacteria bacterium RIFCSPHIGHO2_12_FULL_44_10]